MRFFICRRYQLFWTKIKKPPYFINRRCLCLLVNLDTTKNANTMLIFLSRLDFLGRIYCFLLSTLEFGKESIKLFKHPNPNSKITVYVIPIIYVDRSDCFYPNVLKWCFDRNDKRKIKRIKKHFLK